MLLLFVSLFVCTRAYLEETIQMDMTPTYLSVSNGCMLMGNSSTTILRYHNGTTKQTHLASARIAVNNACDMVVLGFPENNSVVLWRPGPDTLTNIQPPEQENVQVGRFGYAVDVQGQTWVVGAPGLPNDSLGQGATIGYAFVYFGNELHSCRSMYETYCYPLGEECVTGMKNWKDYYKFLKGMANVGLTDNDTASGIPDEDVAAFQKMCIPPQLPYYATGPLDPVRVAYFSSQQFGYDVALSGSLYEQGTALFVSAPGDTRRFMEDNDGSNYGRVYMWDTILWQSSANSSVPLISWFQPSVYTPLIPPSLPGATYRAFGRAIAASSATLAVSSYPLYENTREPFIMVYECNASPNVSSLCTESAERGIAIDDLRNLEHQSFHALKHYVNAEKMSYSDGKTSMVYIPADVDGDTLGDWQNELLGSSLGVTGSNVLVPDKKNEMVHRFGRNTKHRETHPYVSLSKSGTNTGHWVHLSRSNEQHRLTHLWPCPEGFVSGKVMCAYGDTTCIHTHCIPCDIGYYAADGWLEACHLCPTNYTTYEVAQTSCTLWVAPDIQGMSLLEMLLIMGGIIVGGGVLYGLVIACQYACFSGRKSRF